jgi:hypothetical protein
VIPLPPSRHLRPGLKRKILGVALLRLRSCSIGQVKSAANPGAVAFDGEGLMAVFNNLPRLIKNSQIVAPAGNP